MLVAFDTSVLVAAQIASHRHHARALPWLRAVADGALEGMVNAHALAEVWSVLTKLPLSPPLDGRTAQAATLRIREKFRVLAMTPDIYEEAILRCTSRALRSGAIYDALHLVNAERNAARAVLTFNESDFIRLALPDSPRIVVPPEPPAITF
jgi:predicted nucleic acid-binding protein